MAMRTFYEKINKDTKKLLKKFNLPASDLHFVRHLRDVIELITSSLLHLKCGEIALNHERDGKCLYEENV
ncbi:CLUMA_CG011012, isoform A [Clunio marinus]|uniref:CLUMA_CG011012, isoform A n=1 Tax=Clunio marinus TaxID=568069 RepID=A0A1J1ID01_9DIPT|nr:CLUMA_CG011012, isoform A [Clunio marinus]